MKKFFPLLITVVFICINGYSQDKKTGESGQQPFNNILNPNGTTDNIAILDGTGANPIADDKSDYYFEKYSSRDVLTAMITGTDVSCYGYSDGIADLEVTGGTPPYTYSWLGGETTEDLSGLPPGTYYVTVSDDVSGTATDQITINEPLQLQTGIVGTDVSCNGGSDGAADLNVSGGTQPYNYYWSNGETTQDLYGLVHGEYNVTVIDDHGCEIWNNIWINQPSMLEVNLNKEDVTCYHADDGQITTQTWGGTDPYTYSWSNGETTRDIFGLSPGPYTLTVSDDNDCQVTGNVTIYEPSDIQITAATGNVSCYGWDDGYIDLTVFGGQPGYWYNWNIGDSGEDLWTISAGEYSVTVTDQNGCEKSENFTITQPEQIVITYVVTPEDQGNDGAIDVTVTGGTPSYNYQWETGETTEDLTGLAAGVYHIMVEDQDNCWQEDWIPVNNIACSLEVVVNTQDVSCYDYNDGEATAVPSNGTPPYTYYWDGYETTESTTTGLHAGNYTLGVSDAEGCIVIEDFIINQPGEFYIELMPNNITCFGDNDGSIDMEITGGTSPYEVIWSNGETTQDPAGLQADNYEVTVTDANGCITVNDEDIFEPGLVEAHINGQDISCNGNNDGFADLSVTGGTQPYFFNWSTGETEEDLWNVGPGTYSVTVTDINGCTATDEVTIYEPAVLQISLDPTHVLCYGGNTGAIDVEVTGGVTPYSYSWNNGETVEDLTDLTQGYYEVWVQDAHGCQIGDNLNINESTEINLEVFITHEDAGNDGSIDLSVSGGVSPYDYLWSTGATTEDIINLSAGFYSVTVTDDNECDEIGNYSVNNISCTLGYNIDNIIDANCYGENTGEATVLGENGNPPYIYTWSDGQTNSTAYSLYSGEYWVTVEDQDGCAEICNIFINQPEELTGFISHNDVQCYGQSDGYAGINISGGVSPYSYIWSSGGTDWQIFGLVADDYYVTVTDEHGCSIIRNVTISQPTQLVASIEGTDITCSGYNDGTADLTVTGGVSPYYYNWDHGPDHEDVSDLWSGSFHVNVQDDNGCWTEANITINEPEDLTVSFNYQDITCYGADDGYINSFASGGTGSYTYDWNNGETTQNISGLEPGYYEVMVTDENECTATNNENLYEPPQIMTSISGNDLACSGDILSMLDLSVSGGVSPYYYEWNTGSNNEDLFNIPAGSYQVTVTDDIDCQVVDNFTVNQPEPIDITVVITHEDEGNDGAIDITVTGGTDPYSYNWSNGESTEDLTGLTQGIYQVTVTDENGCTAVESFAVNNIACTITATAYVNDVSCFGYDDGSAEVSVQNGTEPYTYLWSNGQNGNEIIDLTAGLYFVTVEDDAGCVAIAEAEVNQPAPFNANIDEFDISCFGLTDGELDLTISGGTEPYSYSWSTGVTTEDITGLGEGTYYVTITDGNGCETYSGGYINEPVLLEASVITIDVECHGYNNGSIDLSVSGGIQPYSFNWSTGSSFEDLWNLGPGSYQVTVTDDNGCTVTEEAVIYEPAELTSSIFGTDILCAGESTGAVDLTVSGGTEPYSYSWNNGETTQDLTDVTSGYYEVAINDANWCSTSSNIDLSEPQMIVLNGDVTPEDAGNDGAVDLTVTGGVSPYDYIWSTDATTEDISGLTQGVYTVTVTDQNSCTKVGNYAVNNIGCSMYVDLTPVAVSCYGADDGQITATPQDGTSPYLYTWSDGQSNEIASGLYAGEYTVTVEDDAGCIAIESVVVQSPEEIIVSADVNHVSCYNMNNGSITLNVSGGVPSYNYNWAHGPSSQIIVNLAPDTYYVTVTDNTGCEVYEQYIITEPTELTASIEGHNVSCYGENDGWADLTVSGGTPGYNFNWSEGGSGEDIYNLGSGYYYVDVSDQNGCQVNVDVTIYEPEELNAYINGSGPSCYGLTDGVADLVVSGGTQPYTYEWSTMETTEDISGLGEGTFSVDITDANGCEAYAGVTFYEPLLLEISIEGTDLNCFNDFSGAVDLTVSGGTQPYNFDWSNGEHSEDMWGVSAGTYYVTVTDMNNCSVTDNVTINEPPQLQTSIEGTDLSCYDSNDGAADLTVSGGTEPYYYNWSNGATTQDLFNIGSDNYNVTVTDDNGCAQWNNIWIYQPSMLEASVEKMDISCYGAHDGQITTQAWGGTEPYSYLWSNSETTQNIYGLGPGSYTVTITDDNDCEIIENKTIYEPSEIMILSSTQNVSCYGWNDGYIDITVLGGEPDYWYNWSNGDTFQDLWGITAGDYTVTVIDQNGCEKTDNFTITEPEEIVITYVVTPEDEGNDGAIDVTVTGGNSPYYYQWETGETTEDLTGLAAGVYHIVVTDQDECTQQEWITVNSIACSLEVVVNTQDVSCFDYNDGEATAVPSNGTPPYIYYWNGEESTDATVTDLYAGEHNVGVVDDAGCIVIQDFEIHEPGEFFTNLMPYNISCFGETDGAIDMAITGGTSPYEVLWSNEATTQNLAGLGQGVYSVTVTDANGCETENNVEIFEPGLLEANISGQDISCNGNNDGFADLSVTGGTQPYFFNWSTGATEEDLWNLGQGDYYVTVTDNNGCSATGEVTINEPAMLQISLDPTDILCNGENTGAIDLEVSGGTIPYSYSWNNGQTVEDLADLPQGYYEVWVQDVNGCEINGNVNINEPPEMSLSAFITHEDAGNDGAVDLNVNGGMGSYYYEWSNGETTEDINNLTAGIYSVTVTDDNGCEEIGNYSVNNIGCSLGYHFENIININCYGDNTGEATVVAESGNPPYTYLWSDGQTDATAILLYAGEYWVTVEDQDGCVVIGDIEINQSPELTGNINHYDPQCYGQDGGWAGVNVNGGSWPYSYLWSNDGTDWEIFNLVADDYSVTVTDGLGCTVVSNVTISQPPMLGAEIAGTDISCYGNNDGAADLTVTGGTPPYYYNWDHGSNSEDIFDLWSGSFHVNVQDDNGCWTEAEVTINEPDVLEAWADAHDVTCNGINDGYIDLYVDGGTEDYSYDWSNGATTQNITGLGPDNYSVTVTDENGCEAITEGSVSEPPQLQTSISGNDLLCAGDLLPLLDLTVTGGVSPYYYDWNTGDDSEDLTDVPAGIYEVTITDDAGCEVIDNFTINEPDQIDITAVITHEDQGNDGAIDITVSGGVGSYSYNWSNGETTEDLNGLTEGVFQVTVTDDNECTAVESFAVNNIACNLTASTSVIDVTCYGYDDGEANVTAQDGTEPYTYLWSDGQTDNIAVDLIAGIYNVTVEDDAGCIVFAEAIITQPDELDAYIDETDISCNGLTDGTADLIVEGGTEPYSYIWSTGVTTEDITGLGEGNYFVTVTDENGCKTYANGNIEEPALLEATIQGTDITCYGDDDGSADLTVTGGTEPYSYIWSTGDTFEDLWDLGPDTYYVTVTDINGCTATSEVIVSEPLELTASIAGTDILCGGESTGIADLTVSGGTQPYMYSWNNGETTEDLENIEAGYYGVAINDANWCTTSADIFLSEPQQIVVNGIVTPEDSGNDGAVDLTVTGGVSPYQFIWSTGATTEDIGDLTQGVYDVTVTDQNLCEVEESFVVNNVGCSMYVDLTPVNVSCYGADDGQINAVPQNGTSPYSYIWSDGQTNDVASGLVAGEYSVTVEDDAGCVSIENADIFEPEEIVISANINNVSCYGSDNGNISLNVNGGVPPYTYLWSNSSTLSIVANLAPDTYDVTVTDNTDCEVYAQYVITEPETLTASIEGHNVTCNGENDGWADLTVTGGTGDNYYDWTNEESNEDIYNLAPGYYLVNVSDENGCHTSADVTITEPDELDAYITGTDPLCNGSSDGEADLTVTGGTIPYSYEWSTTDTDEDITGIGEGYFVVDITDANGCEISAEVTLNDPPLLEAVITGTDVSCYDGDDGEADLAVTGGTPPYNYIWSNGGSEEDIADLIADTYHVTVTDANNCEVIESIVINEPAEITGTDEFVICEGDSIFIDDAWQTEAGTYYEVHTAVNDCDSTVEITLTVNPVYLTPESAEICEGDSIFLEDAWQHDAGVYYDTLLTEEGCDSIIETSLTVDPVYVDQYTEEICEGDSVMIYDVWQHDAGIYYDSLTSEEGCDSIIQTELIVHPVWVIEESILLCEGDSAFLDDEWQTESGVFTDTLNDEFGCDSIIITNLVIEDVIVNNLIAEICEGDSVFAEGAWQTVTGIYYDTLTAEYGCDSVVVTDLTVHPVYSEQITEEICEGDSIYLDGAWQTEPGVYTDMFMSEYGCDSIVETELILLPVYEGTDIVTTCEGDSVLLGGAWQTEAGLYEDVYVAANGCDSIVTTELVVNPVWIVNEQALLCTGDSIFLEGEWQTVSGTYTDSLFTAEGCDSIVVTELIVDDEIVNNLSEAICEGDSILLEGEWQTEAGMYYDTLTAVAGCDSIVATDLFVAPLYSGTVAEAICEGDSIYLEEEWQIEAGMYTDTLASEYGCDSIVVTELTVNPSYEVQETAEVCEGDSAFLAGEWQTQAGTYYDEYLTEEGCDSIIVTELTVHPAWFDSAIVMICTGDSLYLGGDWQTESGFYTDSMQTEEGCDSMYVTELIVSDEILTNVTEMICEGDSIFVQDAWQTEEGIYFDTLTAQAGCDSIVITDLVVNPLPVIGFFGDTIATDQPDTVVLDAGEFVSYEWQDGSTDQTYAVPDYGWYYVTVTDEYGCVNNDSIFVDHTIDINDIFSQDIIMSVYPNPNKGFFTLEIENPGKADILVSLMDYTGRVIRIIKIKGETEIIRKMDVSNYAKGIYLLKVNTEGNIRTEKIIVQ